MILRRFFSLDLLILSFKEITFPIEDTFLSVHPA